MLRANIQYDFRYLIGLNIEKPYFNMIFNHYSIWFYQPDMTNPILNMIQYDCSVNIQYNSAIIKDDPI